MFNRCYKCMKPLPEGQDVCPECGFDRSKYATEAHQLDPGTILNSRYEVGMVLGEGGFGITYVGRDTVLDMRVAIKEFFMHGYVSRTSLDDPTLSIGKGTYAESFLTNKDKFIREARVLAQFSNERGIVGIRDYFEANNTAYIVMDFLEGQTLDSYLKKNGTLTWDKLYEIMHPILKSLVTVHKEHVIHRDISPDNIMITNDGEVKLLDFGAARAVSENDVKSLSVILKPGYAPEEQYRSKGQQGPWTDIYALCATMYKSLTGKTPDDSMERMFEDNVPSPTEAGANCPQAVSDVIMKGMAVKQVNRYQSVSELMAAFDAAVTVQSKEKADTEPAKETPKPVEDDPNKTVIADQAREIKPEPKPVNEKKPKAEKKPEPKPTEKKSKKGLVIGLVAGVAVIALVIVGVLVVLPAINGEETEANITYNPDDFGDDASLQTIVPAATDAQTNNYVPQLNTVTPYSVPSNTPVSMFSNTPTPVPTASLPAIGEIITFGKYEQDNITSNGKEDIEWLVVNRYTDSNDMNIVMAISVNALEGKAFDTKGSSNWEKSSLRKWLNGTFMNEAFSSEEQNRLSAMATEVGTTDKVAIMSKDDAQTFFNSDYQRICYPTAYAKARGAWSEPGEGTTWWWLLSPIGDRAGDVTTDGDISETGGGVTNKAGAVRPIIMIAYG